MVARGRSRKREGRVEENSTRRSSAAITGCQLAKKSNARLPSLCDAMLMACRCLFSTRCLHTWLDPRGISEMFLAPIRNHILLLSSLSLAPPFPSSDPLPPPSLWFSLWVVPLALTCVVPCVVASRRPRPPIVDVDDIGDSPSLIFPPPQICLRFPVYLFPRVALTLARRTLLPTLPSRASACIGACRLYVSASCVSRERANYNPRWALN